MAAGLRRQLPRPAVLEKLGWAPTGERTKSSFPPHAELLRYERDPD
jgi:hypothetical protein